MVGHGGCSAGSYLVNPTSPIPSHCAVVIVLFKSVPVHQLSWLALWRIIWYEYYDTFTFTVHISLLLQDLIIEVIYADIVRGKLDQTDQQFEVDYAIGRDIRPEQISEICAVLQQW